MNILYEKITAYDLRSALFKRIQTTNRPFWTAFFITFFALNLIFIYHGAHFLFGDHDWKYIKDGIPLTSGLFEGRFTQFILIKALTDGEILPILNNLIGFAGFSLGLSLLAKYWQLPHTKTAYTLFTLFTAITPYILSFMYFAFLIPPVLSWNAVVIAALLISEKETAFSLPRTLSASLLLTAALGGYPPVINLIGTAFAARLLIACTSLKHPASIKTLFHTYRWTVLNIITALLFYKLTLIYLTKTNAINPNYYNLQTISLSEFPQKALLILKDIFKQFRVTLPFISSPYKTTLTAITILSAFSLIYRIKSAPRSTAFLMTMFYIALWLAPMFTLFISPSLKETEFSPRIDFFGFTYAVAAQLALTLNSTQKFIKNLSALLAVISIFISQNLLIEAQKSWHLGFKTELNLYRRILKRFETNPLFNPNARYIIVQGGSPAFRAKYYHTPYTHTSDDLLGISYVPGMNSAVMWNFASPTPYADTTSYVYTFSPDTDFINHLQTAAPFPSSNSIAVGGYWILLPLTTDGLNQLRRNYLPRP